MVEDRIVFEYRNNQSQTALNPEEHANRDRQPSTSTLYAVLLHIIDDENRRDLESTEEEGFFGMAKRSEECCWLDDESC